MIFFPKISKFFLKRKLYIIASAGRDGSLTVANLLQDFFDLNELNLRVCHEYKSNFFNHYFSESGSYKYKDELIEYVKNCPYDVIVGNGSIHAYEYFAKFFNVTLIHLKRANKKEAIQSLSKNMQLFPRVWGKYIKTTDPQTNMFTAYDLFQKSKKSWDSLSYSQKAKFYYEEIHRIIDSKNPILTINTEDLNSTDKIKNLFKLINKNALNYPSSMHMNKHYASNKKDNLQQNKVQRSLGKINVNEKNFELYLFKYFLNYLISYVGWQINKSEALFEEELLDNHKINDLILSIRKEVNNFEKSISELHELNQNRDT